MADGDHIVVDAVQQTGVDAAPDLPLRQAQFAQLAR